MTLFKILKLTTAANFIYTTKAVLVLVLQNAWSQPVPSLWQCQPIQTPPLIFHKYLTFPLFQILFYWWPFWSLPKAEQQGCRKGTPCRPLYASVKVFAGSERWWLCNLPETGCDLSITPRLCSDWPVGCSQKKAITAAFNSVSTVRTGINTFLHLIRTHLFEAYWSNNCNKLGELLMISQIWKQKYFRN